MGFEAFNRGATSQDSKMYEEEPTPEEYKLGEQVVDLRLDMKGRYNYIDENDEAFLIAKTLTSIKERGEKDKHFTGADHYINALVGECIDALIKRRVPWTQSVEMFRSLQSFLLIYPVYNTEAVCNIMRDYKFRIDIMGLTSN